MASFLTPTYIGHAIGILWWLVPKDQSIGYLIPIFPLLGGELVILTKKSNMLDKSRTFIHAFSLKKKIKQTKHTIFNPL